MLNAKVRIGIVQMAMHRNKERNIARAVSLIRKAAAKKADIVCLPELFSTLYFPQDEHSNAKSMAEPMNGKTVKRMTVLSGELGIAIVVPFYEKSGGKYYNTTIVVEDGKVLGKYRKMHIPHDPLFYEKNYFSDGNLGFEVIKTKKAKIAPLICYDQWFPEAARISTLKGAEIIFYPTAIGWIRGYDAPDNWMDSWITMQRSHAIANGIHVVSVNRTGVEGRLDFWGNSFVADSFGKILGRTGKAEGVLVSEIDLSDNERIKVGWGFMRNRRPDEYAKIRGNDSAKAKKLDPLSMGYFFPAEWERHDAVFTAWPYDIITFPDIKGVENDFAAIIRALQETRSEDVKLFVTGGKMRKRAEAILLANRVDLKKIKFFAHNYADVWFRDCAPTFVVNRKKKRTAAVRWRFNAWGKKFMELYKDRNVPLAINRHMKLHMFEPGIFCEGGAIETNGKGVVLTTKSCLLNDNRNPWASRGLVDELFKQYLGAKKVIWLEKGLREDHTDGHIDNLARFTDENTIVCPVESDISSVNYTALRENYAALKKATDTDGRKFRVVTLPLPKVFDAEGKRLAASYTNFYIANNAVLVPVFNTKEDGKALKIISGLFRKRKIVPIDCSRMVHGGGAVHCITQQQPKV